MASVRILDPVATSLEGVTFTGTRDGVVQQFQLLSEALGDIEYTVFDTTQALMQAFTRHHSAVATAAGKALDAGQGGDKPVVIQSLL